MKIYPTIAEALTLGGSKLAVDGVVLVGEHGNYPRNEKGQTKYPRYEFFEQIVKVFAIAAAPCPCSTISTSPGIGSGRARCTTRRANSNFPFMAGSSLPVTWRTPSVEMPLGARISEAMCVCYGGVDSYDFHGLETIQCMVERRRGGETGVQWVQAYRGDKFWEALREGVWPKALMDAALCRSHTLVPARPGFNNIFPTVDDMRRLVRDPVAYRYQHTDGLKCTMLLMNGLMRDFNFAAYVNGRSEPWSTQMYLPMPDGRTTLANFFSPQVNHMRDDVPDRQGALSGGAHAAHHRADRGRRGEPLPRADALRDAAPGHPLPAYQRIHLLENLTHADATHFSSDHCRHGGRRGARSASRSASRSSRPSTATSRTRSTWATASWSATRTPARGTSPT